LKTTSFFVLGVMAASNCAGVILKSVSIEVGTSTGTPQIILQFQNKKPNMVLVNYFIAIIQHNLCNVVQ
jgi:hypothetical protein